MHKHFQNWRMETVSDANNSYCMFTVLTSSSVCNILPTYGTTKSEVNVANLMTYYNDTFTNTKKIARSTGWAKNERRLVRPTAATIQDKINRFHQNVRRVYQNKD